MNQTCARAVRSDVIDRLARACISGIYCRHDDGGSIQHLFTGLDRSRLRRGVDQAIDWFSSVREVLRYLAWCYAVSFFDCIHTTSGMDTNYFSHYTPKVSRSQFLCLEPSNTSTTVVWRWKCAQQSISESMHVIPRASIHSRHNPHNYATQSNIQSMYWSSVVWIVSYWQHKKQYQIRTTSVFYITSPQCTAKIQADSSPKSTFHTTTYLGISYLSLVSTFKPSSLV